MSKSERSGRRGGPIWLALGAVGLVIVVAIVTLPVFSGLRQWILPARRGAYPSCAINLQQIGLAIKMYASENNGYCPDGFEQLLLTQDIGPIVFVCPASNDTTATGKTLAEIVSNLSAGGHLSYFYNGKGKKWASLKPTDILAYEPLSNHGGSGGHILFGDGHVEFSTGGPIWAKLPAANINRPATRPATGPATRGAGKGGSVATDEHG
jgi:prepilin-type processing-associated H-X9-DG protein